MRLGVRRACKLTSAFTSVLTRYRQSPAQAEPGQTRYVRFAHAAPSESLQAGVHGRQIAHQVRQPLG